MLALFVAAPAAHAKDFRVGPARAVVNQVKASADGRLTLSAARAGCSGPARVVVKRRGRVVLRARLSSTRTKLLKGSRLATGRHRLVLRVQGSRRSGRCKARVKVRRLWVAPAGRTGEDTTDDPADADDDEPDSPGGPDASGPPPAPVPGEDDETNEDADA